MRKIIKKEFIIGIIIGIVLASSVAVFANINASQIDYKNNQKVDDALDDLYTKLPNGQQSITTNGTYDISKKASVKVDVRTSKTELWRNLYTSNAFGEQTITLTGSLANYSHFVLEWKRNKEDNDTNKYEDIFKITPNRTDTASIAWYTYGANGTFNNGAHFARKVFYVSSNQLKFGLPGVINNDFTSEDVLIPIAIYGINILY